jgi:hypothetical protein
VRESLRYITIAIFELSLMAVIPEQHEGSSADRDREEGPCVDYISLISSGKESHVMLVLSQTKYLSFLGGEEDFLLMLY